MDILSFIAVLFVSLCGLIAVIGYVTTKYDTAKLKEENEELKYKLSRKKGGNTNAK